MVKKDISNYLLHILTPVSHVPPNNFSLCVKACVATSTLLKGAGKVIPVDYTTGLYYSFACIVLTRSTCFNPHIAFIGWQFEKP